MKKEAEDIEPWAEDCHKPEIYRMTKIRLLIYSTVFLVYPYFFTLYDTSPT